MRKRRSLPSGGLASGDSPLPACDRFAASRRASVSTLACTLRVAIFGHFGVNNFGNESTLQAVLYHLRRYQSDADITCICSNPEAIAKLNDVRACPISETFLTSWIPSSRMLRVVRRVFLGMPSEPYRWIKGYRLLRGTDMLVIPGTGLLTDINGLRGFGPYSVLKWSLLARLCHCELLFVSVGAGPISSGPGKRFVRWALALAHFRSYRDTSSRAYLESIGFRAANDPVYPDLVFSLPRAGTPPESENAEKGRKPVVGIGLMAEPEKLNALRTDNSVYSAYLESLVSVAGWLLTHGYDVRLLLGDLADLSAKRDFRSLVRERISVEADAQLIDEPICSVDDLVAQIEATDIVIATRFHNVVLALLCDKPVISISFHHKCESLMKAMGLSDYCLDLRDLKADAVIARLNELELNAERLKPLIREKAAECRKALDEQYRHIFSAARPSATQD